MLTTSFTNGLYKFTDGEFISPSVPMDNLYIPMVNWLNNANYLIHQRTLQIYRWWIHFSIGTEDNLYLPMVNWLTIGTDGTDGQCFGVLPWWIGLPSVPVNIPFLPMVYSLYLRGALDTMLSSLCVRACVKHSGWLIRAVCLRTGRKTKMAAFYRVTIVLS
jgi:hypothetical protein